MICTPVVPHPLALAEIQGFDLGPSVKVSGIWVKNLDIGLLLPTSHGTPGVEVQVLQAFIHPVLQLNVLEYLYDYCKISGLGLQARGFSNLGLGTYF